MSANDELQQPTQGIIFCKNHAEIPSGYFQSDQPWIRYCKNCALNLALCGRKIEKQMSSQEFQRKLYITSVVEELKKSLEMTEESSGYFSRLNNILQEAAKPLKERIQQIQTALQQLTEAKNKLQSLFETQIYSKINNLLEKQGKIAITSLQIKKQLQNIESNFGTLLELGDSASFQQLNQRWTNILQSQQKQIINQQQFTKIKCRIIEVMQIFYEQFDNLGNYNFSSQFDRKSTKIPAFDQTFDMVLTPVDSNSLNQSLVIDDTKNNHKIKGQLKLRSQQKMNTERDCKAFNKKNTAKRPSFYGVQNSAEWQGSSKNKNNL